MRHLMCKVNTLQNRPKSLLFPFRILLKDNKNGFQNLFFFFFFFFLGIQIEFEL